VIDAGDQVVEVVRIRATTAHGGVEIEHRAGTVYRLKDKRIVAITFYLDAAHALEAAGLSD
jgi:ketosteroid isomerase-like protein